MEKKKKISAIESIYEWIETFLVALAAVVIIFTFFVKFVTVSGDSLRETFHNGDRLIISSIGYTPKTGDVVVVDVSGINHGSEGPYIKRVIATGGQEVRINPYTWEVFVDGKLLDEPYVEEMRKKYEAAGRPYMSVPTFPEGYICKVPEGHVFFMGDNRNGSSDGRVLGTVEEKYIIGKVLLRLIPDFGVVE